MKGSVTYTMEGFTVKQRKEGFSRRLKITDNKPYEFNNHSFLESFYINDNFTEITFNFKEGLEPKEYLNGVSDILETICFNIITYPEIQTTCPLCRLKMINGEKIQLNDYMSLTDSIQTIETEDASTFYEKIVSKDIKLAENKAAYKELFYVLHNPNKVVQFIGLYDVLADLVKHGDTFAQSQMHDFFGRNKARYPFITFSEKAENSRGNEDSFTKLRNDIAHSKRVGIEAYLEIAENISYKTIQQILLVISDILSGNVTP